VIRKERSRRPYRLLLSLTLGAALPAVALVLTLLLQSVVSTAGYIFFFAAVLAGAWYGGPAAGWLATILSSLAVIYFFIPPFHSFHVHPEELPVFIEFAVSSAVVGWFSSWRKEAEKVLEDARDNLQTTVEERTAELRRTNAQLLAEIAERKRAEDAYSEARAELARVTRINALSTLAASISHEVNQPLAAVVTNADACAMWLASDPPNVEEARAAVDSIAREGTRASDIVRRIRGMFTKAPPEGIGVELNELIREAAGLMHAEISRNQVVLEIQTASDLPAAIGDRVQLQQVIVNLILNGIEAMSSVTGRPRRLVIRSEKLNDGEMLIAVRDSGTGIEPKDQKRLFDAFFTTKSDGMGMGLAICQSIIEAHGGRLWATANSDHGATLQFTLPVKLETARLA
jgi:C4-dicarboxylate-specific signal transduction histidine kinase